ncbi:MAG: hypothetical protein LBG92_08900 [Prevotellaceae bacterium]|jgi:hypothetical protein|nr:hypothetical protein [Prevotellaceae bacterium]
MWSNKEVYSLRISGIAVFSYITASMLFFSCKKDNTDVPFEEIDVPHFGWSPDFENYEYGQSLDNDIFGAYSENLPPHVDLSDKLPPAGDQGSYGTCVTWAIAYGLRTYMNAVSKNMIAPQLIEPENQFSPADLWMSLPDRDRIGYCGGTSFQPAFNVLVTRGITSLHNVPYSTIKCSGKSSAEWNDDAAQHKIANYFMIGTRDWSVNTFKTCLAQRQAVCFGARLGDKFRTWKSGVLSSDTYREPMYHAMLLVGYDDSKGDKGAFKIFNSWGTNWGENGYIWVDYDFFVNNSFLNCAFTAVPVNETYINDEHEVDKTTEGTDLSIPDVRLPELQAGYYTNRRILFNVYNAGTETVSSSHRWSVILMYYNAYNAADNGVLAHLYYTNQVNGKVEFDKAPPSVLAGLQIPVADLIGRHHGECINQDIPSGNSIASTYYGNKQQYMALDYYMPPVDGYYYLVILVDPYNRVNEINEQNNTYIIAHSDGIPYYFIRGVAWNMY